MEDAIMKAYEVYELNPATGKGAMIGILPERRKDIHRATRESVINWGRTLLGNKAQDAQIYFVEILLQKTPNGNFWPYAPETSLAH